MKEKVEENEKRINRVVEYIVENLLEEDTEDFKYKAMVVAAGITVHEALEAYSLLQKKGINVRVIDLYSVQPVDANALIKNAKECKNRIVVVEDHYFGGIGSVVSEVLGRAKTGKKKNFLLI